MSQLMQEIIECKQLMPESGERKHYMDKGDELIDYYRPSGFRFFTNTDWICPDGSVNQRAVDLIRNCWKFYDSVAVGPAFACNGFMMKNSIAIYVKKAVPVRLGDTCNYCGEYYEEKDIVHVETFFRGKTKICKNCFNFYSYNEIKVGNEMVLVLRNQY